jgi:hypothetical protein
MARLMHIQCRLRLQRAGRQTEPLLVATNVGECISIAWHSHTLRGVFGLMLLTPQVKCLNPSLLIPDGAMGSISKVCGAIRMHICGNTHVLLYSLAAHRAAYTVCVLPCCLFMRCEVHACHARAVVYMYMYMYAPCLLRS